MLDVRRGCRTRFGCLLVAVIIIGGELAGLEVLTTTQPQWYRALEARLGLVVPQAHIPSTVRSKLIARGRADQGSIVTVKAQPCGANPPTFMGTGWPVAFARGAGVGHVDIVTAAHVVWRACHITVETSGGRTLKAQILGLDLQREDLALLSVPGLVQVPFRVATAPVTPGAVVVAVWSPLNPWAAGHATITVTSIAGVATLRLTVGVSAVPPITARGRLVLWAPEYPGASGAPVFNAQGRVIGVVEGGGPPGSPGSTAIPVVAGLSELRAWSQAA